MKIGFEVIGFNKPDEALVYFKDNHQKIKICISDYSMPLIDGADLANRFFEINPRIPTILCSGYLDETIDSQGNGIKGILKKPYRLMELVEAIKKVM
jgi:DNA-binding NtrC family response regulator